MYAAENSLSSWVKGIKKGFQRRTKEQDVPVFEEESGEFRAQLQWKMNERIDLSLWETAHEYWALTGERESVRERERDIKRRRPRRERQRDRNQNEKWGTRLKDCTAKEEGDGGNEESQVSRWSVLWRETTGGKTWHEGESGWTGRNTKQMDWEEEAERRDKERRAVSLSDWPAPDDDGRWLVTWALWLTGSWHMLSHLHQTHTHRCPLWGLARVCALHAHVCECVFGYLENVLTNYDGGGGYNLWANHPNAYKISSLFLRLWFENQWICRHAQTDGYTL